MNFNRPLSYTKQLLLVATALSLLSFASPARVRTLYNSLDPSSLSQQLAFYDLYHSTDEGQQALRNAYFLLNKEIPVTAGELDRIPTTLYAIDAIIALVNKAPDVTSPTLSEGELRVLNTLAGFLPNRNLKGHFAKSEEDVLALPKEEVDLARGLLLSELGNGPEAMQQIYTYEAALDLMALQILCQVKLDSTPQAKIRAINRFIFGDMGFRFPAHSTYAKEIDLYTFLPSVLDSRRGVCLGVSLLYMCLAQRLNLDLEMVTPPGHIYVRYHDGDTIINIETTARGVHVDCSEYLSIDARSLQTRSIKQVIGMAHFNQAAVFWEQRNYSKAIASYRHALLYVPNDPLVQELLAYNLILNGELQEGAQLLDKVKDVLPDHAVTKETIAEDYLCGKADAECLEAIFMRVNETRESLIAKQQAIEKTLQKFPQFRAGWFSLAIAWLQLQREGEALEALEKYHKLDPNDATAEYYMTVLFAERYDYNQAWYHLKRAEKLVAERSHNPESLKDIRRKLSLISPD